jgi:hypothetical protein
MSKPSVEVCSVLKQLNMDVGIFLIYWKIPGTGCIKNCVLL